MSIEIWDWGLGYIYLWDILIAWWGWWESWWEPGANTLAYYPLTSESTVNDMKWTWTAYNLTNTNSVSFWIYQWVNCASFSTNKYLSTSSFWWADFWWNFTENFYFYANNTNNVCISCIWYWKPYNWYYVVYSSSWSTFCTSNNSANTTSSSFTVSSWTRHLATITANSSWFKLYIDWVLTTTTNTAIPTSWNWKIILWAIWNDPDGYRAYFNWYISKVIFESKVWTAQEISDYYNQTKANYWLYSDF